MRNRILIILIALAMTGISATRSFGQVGKFQAGYIYQFTKYVEWPSAYKSGDFVIGVLGAADVNSFLDELASSKKVVNQAIKVEKYGTVGDIGKCNILFVAASESDKIGQILSKIGSESTLIISDKPGLAGNGAAIDFMEKDGKLGFEINQQSFSKHGLNVNSQLVDLALKKY